MNGIDFEKNILHISNNEIIFKDEICQVELDNDKIYVLLDIHPKEQLSYNDYHNVFCYSNEGHKLWQIGVRPKGDTAVYTMINFDNEFLYANDFMGRRYSIDKDTGEIKDMMVTK